MSQATPLQRLQARLRNLGRLGIEAEEVAEMSWVTSEGASVSVMLDYLTRPPRRQIIACGEQETLMWDGIARAVTWVDGSTAIPLDVTAQDHEQMFLEQLQAFLRACDDQRDQRLATADDGVKALAVCEAARRASIDHREAVVTYP